MYCPNMLFIYHLSQCENTTLSGCPVHSTCVNKVGDHRCECEPDYATHNKLCIGELLAHNPRILFKTRIFVTVNLCSDEVHISIMSPKSPGDTHMDVNNTGFCNWFGVYDQLNTAGTVRCFIFFSRSSLGVVKSSVKSEWSCANYTIDLTFTATRYLPPYTPHVGPLDPVTCKEAAPLYWVYGSIRPTTGFHYPKS